MTAIQHNPEEAVIDPQQKHQRAFQISMSHMRGWEAFGLIGSDAEPTVRRLGYGHGGKHERLGTETFDGCPTGVAYVHVDAFDDSPATEGFARVVGPDKRAVVATYKRLVAAWPTVGEQVWP